MVKYSKLIAGALALTVAVGSATPVFAASANKDSVGSVVADLGRDDLNETNYGTDGIVGKDETQQKESEYKQFDSTNDATAVEGEKAEGDHQTQVYATQASSFSTIVPVVLVMDGSAANQTHQAVGEIRVAGNLAGNEYIKFTPDASFALKQTGKQDVTATVTQANKLFCTAVSGTVADMEGMTKGLTTNLEDTKTTVTLTADDSTKSGDAGISAGSWSGSYSTNITLETAE